MTKKQRLERLYKAEQASVRRRIKKEEKDLISHRGVALRELVPKLKEWLACTLE